MTQGEVPLLFDRVSARFYMKIESAMIILNAYIPMGIT